VTTQSSVSVQVSQECSLALHKNSVARIISLGAAVVLGGSCGIGIPSPHDCYLILSINNIVKPA